MADFWMIGSENYIGWFEREIATRRTGESKNGWCY
jgi:hypothetical protein